MHVDLPPAAGVSEPGDGPWYRMLNSYQWFVLVVAALGWLFDTMDQQLFVLARTPALTELLQREGATVTAADITRYGGYATSIFIIGWATGGLIFGMVGDRLGRARTMVITILIYSLFTGLSALSVGWLDFAIYRFITGVGVGGEFAAGVTLVAEVMPAKARPYALAFLQALSAVGNVTAALVSFAIPPQAEMTFLDGMGLQGIAGWRLMFLVGILPAILVIIIRRGLKEPESWVLARQRSREARLSGDDLHKHMGDIRELFSDPRWRYNTIIGVTLAMAGVMGLWGVGFWIPELIRGNVLADEPREVQDWYASMGFLLQNVGAFFGIYAFGMIAGRMGRRTAFAVAFSAALLSTVMVFGFMTEKVQIWWMTPLLGFCSLMIFGGFAVYFPELYPTRLRSTGTGFCYNVARYLAAAAPFILGQLVYVFASYREDLTLLGSFGGRDEPFRYAALSVAMIYALGLFILPFAPETKDRPLPE